MRLPVAFGNLGHDALVGMRGKTVVIPRAHVRHVDAQNPEETIAFARGHLAQRFQKALHAIVILGRASRIQAVGELSAKNRKDANVRAIDMLQEDDLKLDGVLEGMAVVFHEHGVAAARREPVDQRGIGGAFAERRHERFSREAEVLGLAVVRGCQDDESTILQLRAERLVRGTIGLPSAFRADVRRGNAG